MPRPAAVSLAAPCRPPGVAIGFVRDFTAQLALSPEALKLRHDHLLEGRASGFFRMFPALFHQDLRGAYAQESRLLERPSPLLPIDGDPHLANYGAMRDAQGGLRWALNDYDQGGKGRAEADLERLATSIELLGRENGLSAADTRKLVGQMARAWLKAAQLSAPEGSGLSLAEAQDPVKHLLRKAAGKTQAELLAKNARQTPEGWRLQRDPRLTEPGPEELHDLRAGLAVYDPKLRVLDLACKPDAGGSSLGLKRYYALIDSPGLPRILELKQLLPCPLDSASGDLHLANAQQVVDTYRAMGAPCNPLLGVAPVGAFQFLVREREPEKKSLALSELSRDEWKAAVEQAGEVLGRAHSGQAQALRGWVGDDSDRLVDRLQRFAADYAEQARQDYAAVVGASL